MNTTSRMIVVLGLIAAVSAGLLAGVNLLTKDTIEANSEKRLVQTFAELVDGDVFAFQDDAELPLWRAVKDGSLVGYIVRLTGQGYSSDCIDILVGMDSAATVTGVMIFSHSETPGLGSKVAEPGFLAQFTGKGLGSSIAAGEDIDAISGATSSSMAVIGSVSKAVKYVAEYAGLSEVIEINFASVPDGVYSGSARGFGGDIIVKVTFLAGRMTELVIVNHSESADVSDPAIAQIPQAILTQQTLDVDTVSGATISSEGIIAAVRDALAGVASEQPVVIEQIKPGVYRGTARGFKSDITIEITVADGKITDLRIISHDDTPDRAEPAFTAIIKEIIANQDLDVDMVSGATFSSQGLLDAVKNALRAGLADGSGN